MSERRPLDFMTVEQVAKAAGVSRRRVQQLCKQGRLAAFKVAGSWLVLEHSAYAWVHSPRKAGRPPKDQERLRGEQLELDIDSEGQDSGS